MNLNLTHTITGLPPLALAGAGLAGLLLVAVAARLLRKVFAVTAVADALTFVVAGMATVMSGQGMWRFFTNDLHVAEVYIRVCMFGVFEAAMLVCALRTRRRIKAKMPIGIVGPAVWVMASLSGLLAASDVGWHFGPMLARLAAPLIAAFLWELGLSEERIAAGKTRYHWRISPERILIRFGLTEASARTTNDVDAHRRLTRLARAAMRVRGLQSTKARGWRIRYAQRRLHRAMEAAVEHAGLSEQGGQQDALLGQLGALYNAQALAELTPAAPWEHPTPRSPENTATGVPKNASPRLPGNGETNGAKNTITGVSEPVPAPVLEPKHENTTTGTAENTVVEIAKDARRSRTSHASNRRGERLPEGLSSGRDLEPPQLAGLLRETYITAPSVRQVMQAFAVSYDKATKALEIAKNTPERIPAVNGT